MGVPALWAAAAGTDLGVEMAVSITLAALKMLGESCQTALGTTPQHPCVHPPCLGGTAPPAPQAD